MMLFKFSIVSLTLLLLGGCIVLPFSSQDISYEIKGYVAGKKSNLDEKIIVLGSTTGYTTYAFLSAEGSRSKMDYNSTSYEYFIEKNGERAELYFLRRGSSSSEWSHFLNVDNQWFVFNIDADSDEIEIYQFKYSTNLENDYSSFDIEVHNTNAISELYVSVDGSVLVWRDLDIAYHEFNLKTKKLTQSYFNPSNLELDLLLKIPTFSARLENRNFYNAVKFNDQQKSTINPLDIVNSQSNDILVTASKSTFYLERWAAVLNPNTPISIIKNLSNDDSFYVASEARKRIAMRITH